MTDAYPALAPRFAAAVPACRDLLATAPALAPDLDRIRRGGSGLVGERPARFEQEWFPRLDAVAAYLTVRRAKPRRIVEIGSGHSSRFLAQAIVDGGLGTAMICVDPQPRAPLAGLPVHHEARVFGPVDIEDAATLEPGDILFVDSSHVASPGSDVEAVLLHVLPRLPAGVLVHFHDIFLPEAYPEGWHRRRYNEQVAVGALLQGGAYAIDFASRYVATRTTLLDGSLVAALPLSPHTFESSLWLRKMSGG